MKTAILYSGHARTFARTFANHRWMLYRHFSDFAIFASLVADADGENMRKLLVDAYGSKAKVELVKQPDHIPLPAGCPAEESWRLGQPFMHEPYWISVSPQAVLKQLWHLERVWDFAIEETTDDRFADIIVRVRPDIWFHSLRVPAQLLPRDALVPWWGQFGGVNDRFAVLGYRAAASYFRAFSEAPAAIAQGAPLHPESLVAHAIRSELVRRIAVEFSTVRTNGEIRPPEISAADIAQGVA